MQGITHIFDRKLAQQRYSRAAANLARPDFLAREGAQRLAERISDINRKFESAVCLGPYAEIVAQVVQRQSSIDHVPYLPKEDIEQISLPLQSVDLILLAGGLHQVNDVAGTLVQLRHILKPDGLLLACFPGGNSLYELRDAFLHADMEQENGARPRIMPLIDVRDAGNLMQRTGFALPVADVEHIAVSYESPLHLMRELRGMGETNCMIERPRHLRRKTLLSMLDYYATHFSDEEKRVKASFELVMLTGWAPHDSQQKPLRRGSAQISLKSVFPDKKESSV